MHESLALLEATAQSPLCKALDDGGDGIELLAGDEVVEFVAFADLGWLLCAWVQLVICSLRSHMLELGLTRVSS